MAAKPMYQNGPGDFHDEDGIIIYYTCDFESDVSSLPTGASETDWTKRPRPGSAAIVGETGNVYILFPSREWKNPFAE